MLVYEFHEGLYKNNEREIGKYGLCCELFCVSVQFCDKICLQKVENKYGLLVEPSIMKVESDQS